MSGIIRRLGVGSALFVLTLVTAVSTSAADQTVHAQNYAFVAAGGGSTVTIVAGDAVTWIGSGDPHTVTSGKPGAIDHRFPDRPASVGFLMPGDTFTATFRTPGTYPYFCEVHPEQMTGVVRVVAAPTSVPPATPRASPKSTAPLATATLSPTSATVSPTAVRTPPAQPSGPAASGALGASSPQAVTGASPSTGASHSAQPPGQGADAASASSIGMVVLAVVLIAGAAVALRIVRGRRGGRAG